MEVSTSDLYEGAYYLLSNCELVAIEGLVVNGQVTCRLSFNGSRLPELQAKYFGGKTEVNLFLFRRAYSQIVQHVNEAKKKMKAELRAKEGER